ncbi:MAG: HAMP domain-containing sensor histidine kinase [Polyangiales bacterium]
MRGPNSLARRVALSVAFGSLLSGVVVALVTGVVSNRLARIEEDRHLRDAAGTLAYELEVKKYDPAFAASDETQELAHTGIVIAIFEGRRFLAGNTAIPYVTPGACTDAGKQRVCAVPAGHWVSIAARDRLLTREHREVSTRAALLALALTGLLSTGVAIALAYAAIKPLDQLARAVQRLPAHEDGEADLGPDDRVAEVDTLRATLKSVFDRLRRALAESRRFAGNAAHQLRTPLTTIIGELDLALETPSDAGRVETHRARLAAARLATLIDRLLILAGPDDSVPGSAELSLLDALEDALDMLPAALRERVSVASPPEAALRLRGDSAQLVNAIVCALENALQFSAGPVHVSLAPQGRALLLAIEDEGPGVADAERAFAPSYGPQGERTGHGIGLAVIARVTAIHGGAARFAPRTAGARLEMTFARVDS